MKLKYEQSFEERRIELAKMKMDDNIPYSKRIVAALVYSIRRGRPACLSKCRYCREGWGEYYVYG